MCRFRQEDWRVVRGGLTPSNTRAQIRFIGRLTAIGKSQSRGTLVDVSLRLIGEERAMRRRDEQIKLRSGSERAE
jgi:hypothetical protein